MTTAGEKIVALAGSGGTALDLFSALTLTTFNVTRVMLAPTMIVLTKESRMEVYSENDELTIMEQQDTDTFEVRA